MTPALRPARKVYCIVPESPNRPPHPEPRPSSRPERASHDQAPGHHGQERERGQRAPSKVLALGTVALTLYLGTLWLGIAIIGDNPIRSALMAALIVAIAAVGYVFTNQPDAPGE